MTDAERLKANIAVFNTITKKIGDPKYSNFLVKVETEGLDIAYPDPITAITTPNLRRHPLIKNMLWVLVIGLCEAQTDDAKQIIKTSLQPFLEEL